MNFQEICPQTPHCRICSGVLDSVLDLGSQPLANALLESQVQMEETYPLHILRCRECGTVQLSHTVSKERLFQHYVWVTGTSPQTRNYAQQFQSNVTRYAALLTGSFVLEIASNDGTFLRPFLEAGHRVLGVDPAANIADEARHSGIPTKTAFWNESVAEEVLREHGSASFVFARNVLPHVSELPSVIAGLAAATDKNGTCAVEFHYAGDILSELHYDSIYHEHLYYFSLAPIVMLFARHGLCPFHIEKSPISGGSRVLFLSREQREPSAALAQALSDEEGSQINTLAAWQEFARQTVSHRTATREIINTLGGQKVIGFGASARSATYLNYCGMNSCHLAAVIDNNPLKQGKFAPGSRLPIVSQSVGLDLSPDVIFVLAWNFGAELMEVCRSARFKGSFIVPFPHKPHFIHA
jgi:C-methyltransferase C-terminal domain/Putative zinc binding domain/Methyltransferase domain